MKLRYRISRQSRRLKIKSDLYVANSGKETDFSEYRVRFFPLPNASFLFHIRGRLTMDVKSRMLKMLGLMQTFLIEICLTYLTGQCSRFITPENLWFFGVYKGYQMRTMARK